MSTAVADKVEVLAEAGVGRPVVALADGLAASPALAALAQRFQVTVVKAASAEALAAWIAASGAEAVGVLASGAQVATALAAAEACETIKALVLVSPQGVLPVERRPGGPAPKAVLVGSLDASQPRDALAAYRRALPASHVVLMYGAGADIAAERPDAFADVAGDFFDRQGRFAFMTTSAAVLPD
ncbi:MAG TPA: hypothetical protein VGL58_05775 [Caulobacteraceae bacterium]|jgi:hypothetical protein